MFGLEGIGGILSGLLGGDGGPGGVDQLMKLTGMGTGTSLPTGAGGVPSLDQRMGGMASSLVAPGSGVGDMMKASGGGMSAPSGGGLGASLALAGPILKGLLGGGAPPAPQIHAQLPDAPSAGLGGNRAPPASPLPATNPISIRRHYPGVTA